MRIRTIKPELWTDARTGEWDVKLTLFFVATWQMADDAGRLRLDPRLIRSSVDPFDAKFGGTPGIEALVAELVRQGRLLPYEVEGLRYAVVARFSEHQVINKPTKSRLPAPPDGLRESSGSPPVAFHPGGGDPVSVEGSRDQGRDQGSAAAGAREAVGGLDGDPARPRLMVIDETDAGPLGARFRASVEQAQGAAMVPPGADLRARLEQLLETRGLERATAWVVATIEARRATKPRWSVNSTKLACDLLEELGPAPAEEPGDFGSELWRQLALALQAQTRPDFWRHWVRPLRGRAEDGALVLVAPDEHHAAFVRDEHLAAWEAEGARVWGGRMPLAVEAEEPVRAAAGGAP